MKLFSGKKNKNTISDAREVYRQPSRNRAVFSYYKSKKQPTVEPRNKDQEKASFVSRIPGYFAVLTIFLCLGYATTLGKQSRVVIVNEKALGSTAIPLRSRSEYSGYADRWLEGSFMNKNKLTLNSVGLQESISQEFPEIISAVVTMPVIGRKPSVYLTIAEPVFILTSNKQSFVIDEKGRAVVSDEKLPKTTEDKLIKVSDSSGLQLRPGTQAMTRSSIEFIRSVVNQLEQKNIVVSRIKLPDYANELHVYIDKKPYYIKLSTTSDPLQQTGAFLAVKSELEHKNQNPKQYIDVRVEERAYYK